MLLSTSQESNSLSVTSSLITTLTMSVLKLPDVVRPTPSLSLVLLPLLESGKPLSYLPRRQQSKMLSMQLLTLLNRLHMKLSLQLAQSLTPLRFLLTNGRLELRSTLQLITLACSWTRKQGLHLWPWDGWRKIHETFRVRKQIFCKRSW
jgi:hypothetical protein